MSRADLIFYTESGKPCHAKVTYYAAGTISNGRIPMSKKSAFQMPDQLVSLVLIGRNTLSKS
jgi:hypothetical protein